MYDIANLSNLPQFRAAIRTTRRIGVEARVGDAYDGIRRFDPGARPCRKGRIRNPGATHPSCSNAETIRSQTMNRYQPSTPRAAIGIAAVAMTVLTIGVAVVLPSEVQSVDRNAATSTAANAAAPAPIDVAIVPARIDVIAERSPSVAKGTVRPVGATPVSAQERQKPGNPVVRAKST